MFGSHPTQYGALPNQELYAHYRESVFQSLTDNQKLSLLQETVNRDALSKGMVGSPAVQWDQLPAHIAAQASPNGIISVNQERVCAGTVTLQDAAGNTYVREIPGSNIEALNTILHENVHALQSQILNGTVSASPDELHSLAANDFTTSLVLKDDGTLSSGSQYLVGNTANGWYTYRFQISEQQAFACAERETLTIVQNLADTYGQEASFQTYFYSVLANGCAVQEAQAAALYNTPDFAQQVNQVLQNQFYGTNKPVSPNIAAAVKDEMTASYQSLYLGKPGIDPTVEESNAMEVQTVNSHTIVGSVTPEACITGPAEGVPPLNDDTPSITSAPDVGPEDGLDDGLDM